MSCGNPARVWAGKPQLTRTVPTYIDGLLREEVTEVSELKVKEPRVMTVGVKRHHFHQTPGARIASSVYCTGDEVRR